MCFTPDTTRLVSFTDSRSVSIWDLQMIRRELARLDLDWELPKLSPRKAEEDTQPFQVRVDIGDIVNWRTASRKNSESWRLATATDEKSRNPARAVSLANEAIRLEPDNGHYWNTLGVALYRAGNWEESICALQKSMQLLAGTCECGNSFFLAMAYWKRNEREDARQWFNRGVSWLEKNVTELRIEQQVEMRRFREEAAVLLGK